MGKYRFVKREGPDGREWYPGPYHVVFNAEGDTTFPKGSDGQRIPRKYKKWIRKQLDVGRWRPWWTQAGKRRYGRA